MASVLFTTVSPVPCPGWELGQHTGGKYWLPGFKFCLYYFLTAYAEQADINCQIATS